MGVVLVVAGESMAALFMAICVAAVAHDKFRSRA
jgi:hypothetical protein